MTAQPFSENSFSIVGPDRYLAACPSCTAVSDVSQSPWCGCVTRERTPVCTSCGECRCKRPAVERLDFWSRAPESMKSARTPAPRSTLRAAQAPLVMVVDDDEEIRLVAQHVIEKLGYRCTTAASGAEALAMMAVEEPKVVITDALMPKMDGRDLCRFVKRSSQARVVIMTSIYTAPRYKYEAYKTFAADDYLAKPIDFAALQATLGRLLS
ncbi:MAG TPA: response regulator [Thermoanaerobaculia bacterium]|nr:response regulator [Thermoanaerobaculia bacterium]